MRWQHGPAGFRCYYAGVSLADYSRRFAMPASDSASAGLTHLVRYVLTIDNMCAPDCIAWVRGQLAGLGLVVDRVAVGEAEVATTHDNGPDLEAIQAALESGGYRLVHAATKVG
jgi:hypothetical protein